MKTKVPKAADVAVPTPPNSNTPLVDWTVRRFNDAGEVVVTPIVPEAEIIQVPIEPPSPEVIEILDKMEKMRANAGMPLPPEEMKAVENMRDLLAIPMPPAQPVVTIAAIAVGQVIEWKKGKCAGAIGHVVSVEPDGVICVQQPCDLPPLKWFKVPTGEFKIIGRAAGIYKIPAAEIAKHSERFKPKVKKMEEFDSPL